MLDCFENIKEFGLIILVEKYFEKSLKDPVLRFQEFTRIDKARGRFRNFRKGGGGGSRILERGGRDLTFQCRLPSFSYKSLTNIPPKGGGGGGGGARPVGPLP